MSETKSVTFTPVTTPEIRTLIEQRQKLQTWIKQAQEKENEIRAKIIKHYFPVLREGSNTMKEPGIKVKVTHTVTRKLVEETFHGVMAQLDEDHRRLGTLITYVPEFSLAWLKAMPADQRKIFEQTLEIKDGSDQLEITLEETPAK